ncbi:hypothetical protein [Phenylobacterium sp.]|uniref:hypothetical protein n=1 Tax=Phenylobacterium sp. TaxID=1871053 RepID=UPI003BA97C6B
MDGRVDERGEQAKRLRDYFEVQLLFAEAIAARTSRLLSDTCLELTNLHRRFGLGRPDGGAPSAGWARYAAGLEGCASHADRLDWTVAVFADAPPEARATRRFGCFSYELLSPDPVVRIHFSNRDSADGLGPLARAKADRRQAELREMFAHIGAHHTDARTVRGGSWLYNLEAYRRLFPPDYAASTFEPERVRLDGTSSWGQLLDFREAVKPAVRQALLDALDTLDLAAPWKAFPLRALGAEAPIESFHRFYGEIPA